MLALGYIRDNPEGVRKGLAARGESSEAVETILRLDDERRSVLADLEELRRRVNEASRRIGAAKDRAERERLISESKEASSGVRPLEERLANADRELQDALLTVPNVPRADVPPGKTESENVEVRSGGKAIEFDFEPRNHVELGESLGIMDFARSAKISGSGFWLHRGIGAKLQRALINWMLDLHVSEHGYLEVYPPALVRPECMVGTGQLPKFADDSYAIERDGLWLDPTAEVPVTNIHREEILPPGTLPIYYTAYTPCFRREAGAAGAETRGLLRVHQFDKVELVKFVEPETSYDEHETLLKDAEDVVARLGLPYRILLLCAGEMSAAAAKCYDLELWAPGTGRWLEVSSVSNYESYQARRANIRYRPDADSRPRFVHTLNGSGVALPRLVVALLENYQQADGTVIVPEPLRDFLKADVIRPQ